MKTNNHKMLPMLIALLASLFSGNLLAVSIENSQQIETYKYYVPSLHFVDSVETNVDPERKIKLLMPYSTETTEGLDSKCVTDVPFEYVGHNDSMILFSRVYSLEEIKKHLSFDAKAEVGIGWFKSSNQLSFLQEMHDNSYAHSFVYKASMKLKDKKIAVDPKYDDGKRRWLESGQFDRFKKYCGDSFVSRIYRSGEIIVDVSVNFRDRGSKSQFSNNFDFSVPFGGFSSEIKKYYSRHKSDASILIKALQIGGDAKRLGEILGADDDGNAPVFKCSFQNIDACDAMMNKVLRYARDEFPPQLLDNDDENHGPAIMNFTILEYGALDEEYRPKEPNVPTAVKRARQELAKAYETLWQDRSVVNHLINIVVSKTENLALNNIRSITNEHERELRNAGLECFYNLDNCINARNEAFEFLKENPYDHKILYDRRVEKWQLTFNIDGSNILCNVDWIYNSNDKQYEIFDTKTVCSNNTSHSAPGWMWYGKNDGVNAVMRVPGAYVFYGHMTPDRINFINGRALPIELMRGGALRGTRRSN